MKKARAAALLFLISVFLASVADASAPTSSVNVNIPAQNSPLSSSVLRSQFQAVYNDITTIFADLFLGANQILGSTTGGIAVPLTIPPCSTALTYTNGTGFGCGSSSLGTAAAQNVGTSGATLGLLNGNLTFSGTDIFTSIVKHNLNAAALPSAQTGSIVQLGNADASLARLEVDAFGNSAHFTAVRWDGTNASPTALQSGDVIGSFNGWGYNGTAVSGSATGSYVISASQNWTSSAEGTQASIWTTLNGTTAPAQVATFGNDGGVMIGSPTGGDEGAGKINAQGLYVNGVAVATVGGGTALSGLTGATGSNSIENGANTQTWNFDGLTSGNALTLSSTSLTSGQLISATDSNASSTGYAGYFSQSGTGSGYGVYATEGGANNTGYAGYFNNTSTNGYAVYANGALAVTASQASTGNGIFTVINEDAGAYEYTGAFFAPNLVATNETNMYLGVAATVGNAGYFGYYYAGSNSANNNFFIGTSQKTPELFIFNGSSSTNTGGVVIGGLVNNTGGNVITAPADRLDINGGLGFTSTNSAAPANGFFLPTANTLAVASNSHISLESDSAQHWINSGATAPTCGTGCASITAGSTDVNSPLRKPVLD